MVSQEEIRRIRLDNMRRTGVLGLLEARAEALRAGADLAAIAEITTRYYMGEVTAGQAGEILRELSRKYETSA